MVSFLDLDKTFLYLCIDKLLIIKNLFEVSFRVIIELKNKQKVTTTMKSSNEIPSFSYFSKKWYKSFILSY